MPTASHFLLSQTKEEEEEERKSPAWTKKPPTTTEAENPRNIQFGSGLRFDLNDKTITRPEE